MSEEAKLKFGASAFGAAKILFGEKLEDEKPDLFLESQIDNVESLKEFKEKVIEMLKEIGLVAPDQIFLQVYGRTAGKRKQSFIANSSWLAILGGWGWQSVFSNGKMELISLGQISPIFEKDKCPSIPAAKIIHNTTYVDSNKKSHRKTILKAKDHKSILIWLLWNGLPTQKK